MNKSNQKLLGIALLIIGIGLGIWAYQMSDSLESQINEFVSGSPTDQVMFMTIGGVVCAVVGLFLLRKK